MSDQSKPALPAVGASGGQKLEPGAPVNFIAANGKVIAAQISAVEDADAKRIAITGPHHLSVVGVPHDPTAKKPESWHFAAKQS